MTPEELKKYHESKAAQLDYAARDQDMFTQPTTRARAAMHRQLARVAGCDHLWHEGGTINGARVRDCQFCGTTEFVRD